MDRSQRARRVSSAVVAAALVVLAAAGCSRPHTVTTPRTAAAPTPTSAAAPSTTGPSTTAAPVTPVAAVADVFGPAGAAAVTAGPSTVSWLSWSLVDRNTGARTGSANAATERTNSESSIKAWLATDYLRTLAARRAPVLGSGAALISAAIRRSDDNAAENLYRAAGRDKTLADLAPVCGVAVTSSRRGYWSYAQITAHDATAIFDCVLRTAPTYPGGAALVADLQSVAPDGRFGIPQALPAGTTVAVKNGWTQHGGTGLWNVNCVAAWDHYTLAVMTRYPAGRSLDVGAGACADVTRRVLTALP